MGVFLKGIKGMVGGTVIGLARRPGKATLLHVRDRNDTCSVRAEDGGRINLGDEVWWQCGSVYWTPAANHGIHTCGGRCGVDYDIEMHKVGYSH